MIEYLNIWFNAIWELYSIPFPGFRFTIGQVLIGASVAVFGLFVLGNIGHFNVGAGLKSFSDKGKSKGGNNKNIKIDDRRKGDTF